MTCECKIGLLLPRVCGAAAIGACPQCGTPGCESHLVPGPAGMLCPECAATSDGFGDSEQAQEASRRKSYYSAYGDRPEYGEHGYFSQHDRQGLLGNQNSPTQRRAYDALDT